MKEKKENKKEKETKEVKGPKEKKPAAGASDGETKKKKRRRPRPPKKKRAAALPDDSQITGEPAGEISEDIADDTPEAPAEKPAAPERPKGIEALAVTVKTRQGRDYYDGNGIDVKPGMGVIADTGNGLEYAKVLLSEKAVISEKITLPLSKIIRIATPEDEERVADNEEREVEAFNKCLELIEESALPMKLVDAEYSFDCSKLTFCFTAEDRVDFRELVKELASVFKTRIDLRQIGIRDETRITGGLGVCGMPLCCSMFQPEVNQITIKMAKEQGLPLTSSKISGA
ncbi:MAG: hypothetical protein J5830_06345, partial [Clostridia bacterium]|nr:hypothetical protein [Clostridia bacterium]